MNKRKFRTLEEVEVEYYTNHPDEIKYYLEAALEEYQKDVNKRAFLSSLAVAAKVKGGFGKISRETGLNRENLYRALSPKGDPKFSSIINIFRSMGFSLKIT